jgi:inosine-uridine nucleoside N-ribohydrolase
MKSSVSGMLFGAGTLCLALAIVLFASVQTGSAQNTPKTATPVPAILVSDIGDDIDDTWALGLLLKSPELDLKLAVGDYGKAQYRAKLMAKFLQTAGRSDVAVGIGQDIEPKGDGGQAAWVDKYDLKSYPGKVYKDGVQAIVDTIMKSTRPVALIAIGPAPNVAAALQREPRIARRVHLYGMFGSVKLGYDGKKTPAAEWNVKADPKACQKVFTAPWQMTITPLDTCGLVVLDGDRYAKVRDSKDPIAAAIVENYRIWSKHGEVAEKHSSVLFDTVAVYLALKPALCNMERIGLRVTDDGFTVIDDKAKRIETAMSWKDLPGYYDFLVNRLTNPIKR